MAEQRSSSVGGQDKKKETGSKLTGQTGSSSGLTGPQGGLTGVHTGLIGASSKSGKYSKTKNKTRSSVKELLAKYDKEGATQKQKRWPNKVKDANSMSISDERSDSQPCQGNCATMSHSKSVALWSWPHSS
jgi:hypothetical protein